jgi:hypothetical protein
LNEKLNISLKRKYNDISLNHNEASYSIYDYLDEGMFLNWVFFSNKSLVIDKTTNEALSLFNQESFVQNETSLINQPKGVDYFLVIENVKNKIYVEKVLRKILEIREVITSFISDKKLENKENLILS